MEQAQRARTAGAERADTEPSLHEELREAGQADPDGEHVGEQPRAAGGRHEGELPALGAEVPAHHRQDGQGQPGEGSHPQALQGGQAEVASRLCQAAGRQVPADEPGARGHGEEGGGGNGEARRGRESGRIRCRRELPDPDCSGTTSPIPGLQPTERRQAAPAGSGGGWRWAA